MSWVTYGVDLKPLDRLRVNMSHTFGRNVNRDVWYKLKRLVFNRWLQKIEGVLYFRSTHAPLQSDTLINSLIEQASLTQNVMHEISRQDKALAQVPLFQAWLSAQAFCSGLCHVCGETHHELWVAQPEPYMSISFIKARQICRGIWAWFHS